MLADMLTMDVRDGQKLGSVLAGHRNPPMLPGRAIKENRRSAGGRVAFFRVRFPTTLRLTEVCRFR